MTLWIILTFLTTATALALAIPLIRRFDTPPSAEEQVIALGKAQLEELEKDLAGGQIDADEAALARAEIERRIVAAAKAPDTRFTTTAPRIRVGMVFALGGWLVAGATGLYFLYGRPNLPTQPFMGNGGGMASATATTASTTTAAGTPARIAEPQRGAAVVEAPPGNVEELIANLEARLADNPDDVAGLRMLAWSYFNTGRYALAAETYGKSVELDASDPDVLSAYVEARVRAADGLVDARSVEIAEQALALNPDDPRAGYFIGMAQEQAGNGEQALATWQAILDKAQPGDEWAPGLAQRIDELRARLGMGGQAPSMPLMGEGGVNLPPVAGTGGGGASAPGPTQADIAAAQEMTPQDRAAMIAGMVERLANRLAEEPNDPEGWQRLIRAYMVMGQEDKAREALISASMALEGQPDVINQLVAFATDLGLRM